MKKFLGVILLTVLLFSCGGNKNRPIDESLSAFLNESKSIVLFGKADLNTILNKAQYKKIPKFGLAIGQYIDELKQSINTETPVYFALEGPFLEDGTPLTSYAFFDVVNADSLMTKIESQGFDLEKASDITYFETGDVCFGVRNNLAILISKKEEFDAKKYLSEAFEKSTGDVSEGKVGDILAAKGDLVIGMSVQNLYETSNTDLQKLSADKQKSIIEMVEGSYMQSTLNVENGAAILETKNFFSDKLKSNMFFKKDPAASIINKLGTGDPKIGLSMNFDMAKMQKFINDYSPNTMKDLGETLGGPAAFVLATGGDNALSKLLTGEMGIVMVGNPTATEGINDFNFYVGLGDQGKMLAQDFKMFLEGGMAKVELGKSGLSAYSSANYIPMAGKRLAIPKGCEVFGKKGITAFVNLENVDLTTFELKDEEKIILLIKYITFEMDENGSKLYIKAKDGKENLLKQAVDVLVKELSGKIGNLTIS